MRTFLIVNLLRLISLESPVAPAVFEQHRTSLRFQRDHLSFQSLQTSIPRAIFGARSHVSIKPAVSQPAEQ